MKKQLFRRIMALVLAFSMVMSLACTTTFAVGNVDDDGVETLEVTPVDDEAPAEEDDITVPEEEENVTEPEETPAEEETVQPEPETEPEITEPEITEPETTTPETVEPEESAPVEEEELVGDPETEETGWREVANEDGTISRQYWYQDAEGNVIQAKDYFGTDDALANANAYNAYYIDNNASFTDSSSPEGTVDVSAGYYYFDAEGNATSVSTWTLFYVTYINASHQEKADKTRSGYKCLGFCAKANQVGNTGVYTAALAKKASFTAPNGKIYLATGNANGDVYTASTLKKSTFMWHATTHESADKIGMSYQFLPDKNTDEVGVWGIPLTTSVKSIWFGNIHSYYPKAPDKKYCYIFKDGRPTSCDGTLGTYYNSSNKTYYAVYFANSKTCGVSVGYYAAQGKYTYFTTASKNTKLYLVSTKGVAKLYTGIYKCYYYKNGVKTKYKGWIKVRNTSYDSGTAAKIQTLSTKYRGITQPAYAYDYYYFNNSSKCLTGNKKKAPAIDSSDSRSYYYYFDKNTGKLIQNLFTYNTAFKASKMQIICDGKHTNHNTTFLLYNSSTKKYDIAALQVICSTPKNPNGKSGIAYGTYYLSSLSRRSWLQNKSKTMWFSYLTYINTTSNKRTGFFFHSPAYSKQSYKALNSAYNKFGRSNTGGCLRLQTGYCQLVSSISQAQQKKKQYKWVVVKFGNYKTVSPFKRVTQKMIQINLKKFKYDPTTPKSKL